MTELKPAQGHTGWTYMCCLRNDRCICQPPAPQDNLVEAVATKMAVDRSMRQRGNTREYNLYLDATLREDARAVIPIAQAPIIAERDAALAKLAAAEARESETTERGWREGYCAGSYRCDWSSLPPTGQEVSKAWAIRQERIADAMIAASKEGEK